MSGRINSLPIMLLCYYEQPYNKRTWFPLERFLGNERFLGIERFLGNLGFGLTCQRFLSIDAVQRLLPISPFTPLLQNCYGILESLVRLKKGNMVKLANW